LNSVFLVRAGVIACLAFCAACVQVALMAVTPTIAAFARHVDATTARAIVDLDKRQDWPGMLKLARVQLQQEPGRAEWWFLQGYALDRLGQHADAIESYERALRISPEEEGTWLALGQSQIDLGQTERAIQTFKQALRIRPESAPTYLALGDAYQTRGRLDLAIANFRECVRYDPDSAKGWYGLAVAYHLDRQIERRDEALQRLRNLEPGVADRFEQQYPSK
jgi:tetratricopeptide (TPR) repeat protein